ncbi:Zinc finger C2H2 protein [Nosema bombycis CQ1]|jgi:hypothetical protein|uniref:Zinc finger C2H2 protein n=1 Tax=Nosema bombycis (strain CQ1 / CVCC 102059) TaxID=578461 RepID=R0M6I9_NOSB1|nr:Zinc finger C2H2 protein [Nosema bombycis CQ1]|eukprot:EOB13624.1 Zinc finger C2H2 protein [Nosema bombycis CQ1]
MDYRHIKKLLNHYLEKNHPEIDFYKDKEHEELVALHGINYKYYIKAKPFCLYEKFIKIEREKYCKANPYNPNWLDENEDDEEKPQVNQIYKKIEILPKEEEDDEMVDMRKIPRKRRIVKENMFSDEQGKTLKIYKCELPGCNRQYTSSFGLKYHMKEGHSEEKLNVYKPFICPMDLCGRKYKNNNGLKYHLKNYHDIE